MSSSPNSPRKTSPSKRLSRSLSSDPDVPMPVLLVRKYHTNAYQLISEALKIEEVSDDIEQKKEAYDLYQKGIDNLDRGIKVQIDNNGPEGSVWERARNLQEKMKGNKHYCVSRINELRVLIESEKMELNNDQSISGNNTDKNTSNKSALRPRSSSLDHTSLKDGNKPNSSEKPKIRKCSMQIPKLQSTRTIKENKPLLPRQSPKIPKSIAPGVPRTNPSPRAQPNLKNLTPRYLQKPSPVRSPARTPVKTPAHDDSKIRKVSGLKNVDKKMAHTILNEVVESGPGVSFSDIGGIENAKRILREIVILPSMRPELFTGLRAPARGVLLFGPPGNGKTLLAKAIATEANSVFFNISASSLTSKWMGESEKMVKAMFAVARELKPSIIFMDEVDSLLKERSESEHESSRRLKTEFLLCFDGVVSDSSERLLIMAATNRPWELDDAALRRFVKRVYIPLPDLSTRKEILSKLLLKDKSPLSPVDLDEVARRTDGYSGSDMAALAREAALMPLREYDSELLKSIPADKLRNLRVEDFIKSMDVIRPSVSKASLNQFEEWNKAYGTL
eukprot:gene20211-22187_t